MKQHKLYVLLLYIGILTRISIAAFAGRIYWSNIYTKIKDNRFCYYYEIFCLLLSISNLIKYIEIRTISLLRFKFLYFLVNDK